MQKSTVLRAMKNDRRALTMAEDTGYMLPNSYGLTIVVCGKSRYGYTLIEGETGLAIGYSDRLKEAGKELDGVVNRHGLQRVQDLIVEQKARLNRELN